MAFTSISNICNSGDRFIPNRSDINLSHFKLLSNVNKEEKNEDIYNQKPTYITPYIKLLQTTFNYTESPILSFKNKNAKNLTNKGTYFEKIVAPWPCFPRKRPILKDPEIVLDMPDISCDLNANILDWSSKEYIAAVCSNAVYLFNNYHNETKEVIATNIPAYKAIKWNYAGTHLAVAKLNDLQIWNLPARKLCFHVKCGCIFYCYITVIAWDRKDKFVLSGCSKGMIQITDVRTCSVIRQLISHYASVITLIFCPSNRFVCSSGADGLVRIWIWPLMESNLEIDYLSPIRAVSFHPWKDGLLAIGGGLNHNALSIWNANNCKQIEYIKPEKKSFVDCLTWSPVTGEIVSSHQVYENEDDIRPITKILVHSPLNKIVDTITEHQERVLYMMWDSTGTLLGTAGCEEKLCIWNFLGRKEHLIAKKKIEIKKRKNNISLNFGKCIR